MFTSSTPIYRPKLTPSSQSQRNNNPNSTIHNSVYWSKCVRNSDIAFVLTFFVILLKGKIQKLCFQPTCDILTKSNLWSTRTRHICSTPIINLTTLYSINPNQDVPTHPRWTKINNPCQIRVCIIRINHIGKSSPTTY